MADPTKYTISFDFSNFQAAKPKDPPPGTRLDVEFEAISTAIASQQAAIKDLRRSDGKLKNGIVTPEAMSAEAKALSKPGKDGLDGLSGWTPILAIVADGSRRVVKIADWIGGSGTKPSVDLFIGVSGYVTTIGQATDIRGAAGAGGNGGDVVLPIAPSVTALPTTSGAAQSGQRVTGALGTWIGTLPITFGRQWFRVSTANPPVVTQIPGANGLFYDQTDADIGFKLRFGVSGENVANAGSPYWAYSLDTAVVTAAPAEGVIAPQLISPPFITGPLTKGSTIDFTPGVYSETPIPPKNNVLPSITGDPHTGSTATGHDGEWAGTDLTLARRWLRDGAAIPGQTGTTYTYVFVDQGRNIEYEVTGSSAYGPNVVKKSAVVVPTAVPVVPTPISLPTITGTAAVGQTVTGNVGSWNNSPTSYDVQFTADGAPIGSPVNITTTTRDYLVDADTVGKALRFEVVARNASGPSTEVVSDPTAAVTGAENAEGEDFLWTTEAGSNGGNEAISFPDAPGPTIVAIGFARALSDREIIGNTYFELKVVKATPGMNAHFGFDQYPNAALPDTTYFGLGFRWKAESGDINTRTNRFDNTVATTIPFPSTGGVGRFAFKRATREIWIANGAGFWNGSSSAVPGVSGGIVLPEAENYFLHALFEGGFANDDAFVVHARASTWEYPAPTGFTANRA